MFLALPFFLPDFKAWRVCVGVRSVQRILCLGIDSLGTFGFDRWPFRLD